MRQEKQDIVLSVVMPCLNEEKTVGICVKKAKEAIANLAINGEVIVVDNGSYDTSVEVAESAGARVVHEPNKGYGNAYKKGFNDAEGKYIVMADSDNTYDFREIPKFIQPLQEGYDFVMGTRLRGKIMPGAMPLLHQYIGNPFLSWFLRVLFKTNISDAHCGMRSFTNQAYTKMHLKTTGMEFASEMVINAVKAKLKIIEVPITLYANKERKPHLHSFSDGWRHVRFMILYSPYHLFFIPGIFCLLIGFIFLSLLLAFFPFQVGSVVFGPNTAVFGSLLSIIGYNLIIFSYFAKQYYFKISYFDKPKGIVKKLDALFTLERGLGVGVILLLGGMVITMFVLINWAQTHFGDLTLNHAIISITGLTIIIMGIQTIFSSFLVSILRQEEV